MEEMREIKEIKGMTEEQIDEIKQAFLLFGNDSGEIDIKELKEAMESLKLYTKYPLVYKIISNIEIPKNKSVLTFDEFIENVGELLGDDYSRFGIRKMFDLFNKNPGEKTIKTQDFIQKSGELGIKLPDKVFNFILNYTTDDDKETLTFDEFYIIMTKIFENSDAKK